MSINLRLKAISITYKSKKNISQTEKYRVYMCEGKTVDIGILITPRNCDRKIMQCIRITSGDATRIRKSKRFIEFR